MKFMDAYHWRSMVHMSMLAYSLLLSWFALYSSMIRCGNSSWSPCWMVRTVGAIVAILVLLLLLGRAGRCIVFRGVRCRFRRVLPIG